jgi:chlorite dismutase
MKGIVAFYINFHPEYNQDIQASIDIVLKANKEVMEKINKESDYMVMLVPTTKEACRVEKIDFEKPFPRFLSRTHLDMESYEKKKAEKDKEKVEKRFDKVDKEKAENDEE